MILIKKGSEPRSLTEYKMQKGAYYDGCNKGEIREALLREQGYLCAYCMRRIDNNPTTMKIEHWKVQSEMKTEKEKMDFKIMLGVCDGCKGVSHKFTTCDEHRKNDALHVNPFDFQMMETIEYDREGKIKSTDETMNKDLNKVLNLNCEQSPSKIMTNRKVIYKECMERLKLLQKKDKWNTGNLHRLLQEYEAAEEGKKKPYVGVPVYVIKKYLRKCSG